MPEDGGMHGMAERAWRGLVIDQGISAFLQQAHRNNWQQYLASLKSAAPLGWDVCVLTASDDRQALMYRRQLDWKRGEGLLPPRTRFMVIADPDGRRIGSGGATLRALLKIGVAPSSSESILIIHSGGDSRRVPHCSATGKLFARVPRELPDGRASTVFDEFLISLSGLTAGLPPGVLVASGDVLLIFDHLQVSLQRPGVTGVAAAAPAGMGMQHGVYATAKGSKRLRAYLHKPALAELTFWEAVDSSARVQIDTGLAWLDVSTVQKMAELASEETVARLCGLSNTPVPSAGLNSYGDILLPLADSTTLQAYLTDTSDGPATPEVQAARRVIWDRLRGIPFTVEQLQPAFFVHLGTSQEYWEIAAGDPDLRRTCGWMVEAASWRGSSGPERVGMDQDRARDEGLILTNSLVERPTVPSPSGGREVKPALVTDSYLEAMFSWEGAAIVAGVQTGQPLVLRENVVVHQLPVSPQDPAPGSGGGYVTRVFGLRDDAKRPYADPSASFMNRPWLDWLEQSGIGAELLWEGVPSAQRSLWNAKLFPLSQDREESLGLSLPLQDPTSLPAGWRRCWQSLPRLSLAQSFSQADSERILSELVALEDAIAARRFLAWTQAERPAAEARGLLGATMDLAARRGEKVAAWLADSDPVLQLRGYKALSEATGDARWEDKAFAALASMIEGTMLVNAQDGARGRPGGEARRFSDRKVAHRAIRVEAAARIDLGGGWTDTPPYSIERGEQCSTRR